MFFIPQPQSFIILQGNTLIKANIAILLRGFALKWYMSELSNFDQNALNNNSGVKSCINTLFHHFKIPIIVALSFLTNQTYFFDNAWACWPPVQYLCISMRHGIGCNIVNMANQLFFAYQELAPDLRDFILPWT